MSTLWTVLGIIAGIVVLLVVFWASVYNRLVRLRNWSEESFSQVDVQLQRRNDLIPNLVETVKGYSKHESESSTCQWMQHLSKRTNYQTN